VVAKIVRGGRMGGLLAYLVGAGRSNEHERPRLVAGSEPVLALYGDRDLDKRDGLAVGRELDAPRRAFGTRVLVAVRDRDGHHAGRRDAHVWHCSLSLHVDEGQLSDERWGQIASEFVSELGFAGADGEAGCPWVAVRHGLAKAGNDHVHVVVSLVREDGATARVWNDAPRAQQAVARLEQKHGLAVIESRQAGRGARGYEPAEPAIAAQAGLAELPRRRLERVVRGCAAAARDEAEFVRRVRAAGCLALPRYATGRADRVVGYRVAARPRAGERPVWFGGGRLARDLTLPRLRAGWPAAPGPAVGSVDEWRSAAAESPSAAPGRETSEPDSLLWSRYTAEVAALRDRLRAVPVEDRASWAHVAGQAAGALAAWSTRVEPVPGPLAAAAESLARSAQLRAGPARAVRARLPSASGAALLLASAAHGGQGPVAEVVLLRQLVSLTRALSDMHVAAGEAQRAAELESIARRELALVSDRLTARTDAGRPEADEQATDAARVARQGQRAPNAPLSPTSPSPPDRFRPQHPPGIAPDRDRDPEAGR